MKREKSSNKVSVDGNNSSTNQANIYGTGNTVNINTINPDSKAKKSYRWIGLIALPPIIALFIYHNVDGTNKKVSLDPSGKIEIETSEQIVDTNKKKMKSKNDTPINNSNNIDIKGDNNKATQVNIVGDNNKVDVDNSNTTNKIYSSNEYVKLNAIQKDKLHANLDYLLKNNPAYPSFMITIENGSSERYALACEIEELFESKYVTNFGKRNSISGFAPNHPITIICSKNLKPFVESLKKAISPFITAEMYIDNRHLSKDFIRIHINGTPYFNEQGQVRVK